MGHIIEWDNEDRTVVLQAYTEGATKDDLYMLADKSAEMLASVEHIVHLIIDERKVDLMLNSSDMTYLGKKTPPNQGIVVMVVPPHKIRYKTVIQQIGKKLGPEAFAENHFVETVEEARQFLQQAFDVRYEAHNGK